MLFFQVFLLAGYAYAHALERLPRTRVAGVIHLALLLSAVASWPCCRSCPLHRGNRRTAASRNWRILILLATTRGTAVLPAVGVGAAGAGLVQPRVSRPFALPLLCLVECGFADGVAVLSVSDRTGV